jgi:hypothetical protein
MQEKKTHAKHTYNTTAGSNAKHTITTKSHLKARKSESFARIGDFFYVFSQPTGENDTQGRVCRYPIPKDKKTKKALKTSVQHWSHCGKGFWLYGAHGQTLSATGEGKGARLFMLLERTVGKNPAERRHRIVEFDLRSLDIRATYYFTLRSKGHPALACMPKNFTMTGSNTFVLLVKKKPAGDCDGVKTAGKTPAYWFYKGTIKPDATLDVTIMPYAFEHSIASPDGSLQGLGYSATRKRLYVIVDGMFMSIPQHSLTKDHDEKVEERLGLVEYARFSFGSALPKGKAREFESLSFQGSTLRVLAGQHPQEIFETPVPSVKLPDKVKAGKKVTATTKGWKTNAYAIGALHYTWHHKAKSMAKAHKIKGCGDTKTCKLPGNLAGHTLWVTITGTDSSDTDQPKIVLSKDSAHVKVGKASKKTDKKTSKKTGKKTSKKTGTSKKTAKKAGKAK